MKRTLVVILAGLASGACVVKPVGTGATNGGNNGGSSGGNGGSTPTDTVFGPTANAPVTLLVDNEWASGGGADTTTPSYALFNDLLTAAGINYDTIIDATDGHPTFAELQGYDHVFWFSAYSYGQGVNSSVSAAQEAILTSWLDLGGKTLFLYTTNLVYDRAASGGTCNWVGPETDNLLANYVGALSDASDMGTAEGTSLNHASFTVTGQAGFAGEQWSIAANTPIGDSADGINPAAGVTVLATAVADPTCSNGAVPDIAVPVATGQKNVGAKGTSTVVFVGFTLEDVTDLAFTRADFFNGALTYAGL